MDILKVFVPTYSIGLLIDFLWIGVIANGFYKSQLGQFLRATKDFTPGHWVATALVYVAIVGGIFYFVLPRVHTLGQAAAAGAIFGLVVYAVYECTNYALVRGWPAPVVVVDILWGITLCALTAVIAFWLKGKMGA